MTEMGATFLLAVAQDCKATPGQFYDRLLKKCLKCSVVCGSHPSECSQECQSHPSVAVTQMSGDGTALQTVNSRGSSGPTRPPYTDVLVYSLLGLCFAVLLCTLSVALLVLLRRAKSQKDQETPDEGQQPNNGALSSKDCLMAQAEAASEEGVAIAKTNRPRATETCVHCFTGHRGAAPNLYQQAVPSHQSTSGEPSQNQENNHCSNSYVGRMAENGCDAVSAMRIICSPTQTSM
ncbi:tumor necrosis factor receptor superfamily member 13B [Chanos chanos]|uniref:Tumor necrosis factor receptor superfamily member 13B n=1 Tax=Chanos chanos TaxID=29144 RepID=A0A6J2VF54_CHACN|nr:tumor necrosis factor receptor superfamily member 13B [Chanos chanos]